VSSLQKVHVVPFRLVYVRRLKASQPFFSMISKLPGPTYCLPCRRAKADHVTTTGRGY
jgi:hypothetical protein